MLFDEKNYYFFIDEVSFDAQAIFAKNNGYDICKRKIITYYGDKNNPVKEVKTADNYFKIKDTNDKVITKYYIETFKINNFELVDQTYVKIFGLGCYFAYSKDEEEAVYEKKDDEELVKQRFANYDQNYLKLDDKEFLKGENVWKK